MSVRGHQCGTPTCVRSPASRELRPGAEAGRDPLRYGAQAGQQLSPRPPGQGRLAGFVRYPLNCYLIVKRLLPESARMLVLNFLIRFTWTTLTQGHLETGRELLRNLEYGWGRLSRVIRLALLANRFVAFRDRCFSWLSAGRSPRSGQYSQTPSQQYSRFLPRNANPFSIAALKLERHLFC